MLAGKLIHVVDDDAGFLKAIGRLLVAHGLLVRTFSSAEQFQADADPNEAACLILDIHLGGVSGIDLTRQLVESGIRTPVVLVTANDQENTRQAAIQAGGKVLLLKPVSANDLLGALSDAVGPV